MRPGSHTHSHIHTERTHTNCVSSNQKQQQQQQSLLSSHVSIFTHTMFREREKTRYERCLPIFKVRVAWSTVNQLCVGTQVDTSSALSSE